MANHVEESETREKEWSSARVGATLTYTRARVAERGEKGAKSYGLFSGGRSNV